MDNLRTWGKILKTPVSDLKERIILEEREDSYLVDYKAIEELKKQITELEFEAKFAVFDKFSRLLIDYLHRNQNP